MLNHPMISPSPQLGVRTPVHLWAFLLQRAGIVVALGLTATIAFAASAIWRDGETALVPVDLTVEFTLNDADFDPLPHQRARVVVGVPSDWAQASAGRTFETGANGAYTWQTTAALERQMHTRRYDTLPRLLRRPEPMHHLQVAVELGAPGQETLHVLQLTRCENGDVELDRVAVYSKQDDGLFRLGPTHFAVAPASGASLHREADFEPWDYTLEPADAAQVSGRWVLRLAFKRPSLSSGKSLAE